MEEYGFSCDDCGNAKPHMCTCDQVQDAEPIGRTTGANPVTWASGLNGNGAVMITEDKPFGHHLAVMLGGGSQALTDAKIMAAGLDMLNALEAIDSYWKEVGFKPEAASPLWVIIRAAIEKAK